MLTKTERHNKIFNHHCYKLYDAIHKNINFMRKSPNSQDIIGLFGRTHVSEQFDSEVGITDAECALSALDIELRNRSLLRYKEQLRNKALRIDLDTIWYGSVTYPASDKYCEKFNYEFRERVRAYWGYKCLECGTMQISPKLSVHHVHYDKKMCCNCSPRDVVPLCKSCHAATNHNRDYWEDHFTEMVYHYDPTGKCFFTKDEMEIWSESYFNDNPNNLKPKGEKPL